MTTIAVVKKDGLAAIAADTLTRYGGTKETAKYIANHEKIYKYKQNYLAMTGWGATQQAVEDFLTTTKEKLSFDNTGAIFASGLLLHNALKNNYFLRAEDGDDPFETSRLDILIANAYGIFSLTEHRYVQDFSRFYAYGSGADFALGAMFTAYDDKAKSAEEIVHIGLHAAAEFDDGTSLPISSNTIKLE